MNETRARHNNIDRSNASCYCSIGQNHGNLPIEIREAVLRHLLQGINVELIRENGDILVRPTNIRDTPQVTKRLTRGGLRPRPPRTSHERGGRGVLVAAEVFNP